MKKKIRHWIYELKWFLIRNICIILCRKVMVHQKFLKTMNSYLDSGYKRYRERNYKYEGTITHIHNRPYVCLGKGWFIYLEGSKQIEKFFKG